jgi:hypothetical protein
LGLLIFKARPAPWNLSSNRDRKFLIWHLPAFFLHPCISALSCLLYTSVILCCFHHLVPIVSASG